MQQNKDPKAPRSESGGRKAALATYEKKRVKPIPEKSGAAHKESAAGGQGKRALASFSFSHTFTAPLLCAVVFILILAVGAIDPSALGTSSTEAYLSLAAIGLFVFMIPSVFYIRFRSLDMRDDLRLRLPAPNKIMFCVLCTLTLIISSVLYSAMGADAGGGIYTQGYGKLSSNGYDGTQALYFAVCFAIIPAVCEELLFRAVIMSELQKSSVLSAVILNSVFFAMLHFDFESFPFYFFAGIVLSVCAYASNSVIASFAVHLGYNLFAIFGGDTVNAVIKSVGELKAVIIILSGFLLLALSLTLGECQRIYASYAKKNKDSSYLPSYKRGTGAVRFAEAALNPASLAVIVIYVISTLLERIR